MRGKSHAALTVHGFTKSVRKIHLVALGLIKAKVHTALVVLSCLLLPSVSYLYHAFNAEDHLFMDTHLQHCCTIYRHLFAKIFTGSKALREAQHNAEGRTKVNKSNGKWRTTLHMLYLFEIPSQFTQRFSNIILLVSSPCHCSLS
jgi:ABC-type transport system involved in cytochrome bd biosynthesis fused ATPase/permease subunit